MFQNHRQTLPIPHVQLKKFGHTRENSPEFLRAPMARVVRNHGAAVGNCTDQAPRGLPRYNMTGRLYGSSGWRLPTGAQQKKALVEVATTLLAASLVSRARPSRFANAPTRLPELQGVAPDVSLANRADQSGGDKIDRQRTSRESLWIELERAHCPAARFTAGGFFGSPQRS